MTAERIVLWRHGRTEFNHTGRFQGQLDIELDEVGRAQAAESARRLVDYLPTRIVSSDLRRAAATAEALGELTGIPVEFTTGLREINVGRWQGLSRDEIVSRWPDEFAAWRSGEDVAVGGGERRSEVTARVAQAIRDIAATGEGTAVIVSHGAALRGSVLDLLGFAPTILPVFAGMGNANWHVLVPRDGDASGSLFRLLEYNTSARPGFQREEGWMQSGEGAAAERAAAIVGRWTPDSAADAARRGSDAGESGAAPSAPAVPVRAADDDGVVV